MEEENIGDKLDALDPQYKKKIQKLFDSIHMSISMLYEVATHDEKTGIYNNKFFETLLKMEFEKAQRKQEALSISILDIDFFKKINDVYGHIESDDLLKRLANLIKNNIRKSDVVARFGGEEFILMLPETNLNQAKEVLIKIQKAIHADRVLKKHNLTVSAGVTAFKSTDTIRKLKERADKALYSAKRTGRDKFVALV